MLEEYYLLTNIPEAQQDLDRGKDFAHAQLC